MSRNLYKRGFPQKNVHETTLDVLRMDEMMQKQFKAVAKHFLGEHVFHESLPRYPDKQLLKSSLEKVRDNDPSVLAALMAVEHHAHNDRKTDFNRGGGLWETGSSIFNGLWNLVGYGPELNSLYDFMGWSSQENHVTDIDRQYAKTVRQSYKNPDERAADIDGWRRVVDLDTDKFSTWLDNESVHVALKGTNTLDDIWDDVSIIGTNRSKSEAEIREYLEKVAETYPDYELDVSGHSLGSNQLFNIFSEADPTLDRYSRVNLYNPGMTPTHNLDNAKLVANDPERFYLYLNTGDMISNTFVSLLPSERENVYCSNPHHSPIYNHGIAQWIENV